MASEICVCALAAAGILLVIWALSAALLLPAREDCVLLFARGDAEELELRVRSYRFLCDSGLLQTRLYIVDCGLSARGRETAAHLCAQGGAELRSPGEIAELLDLEAEP